MSRVCCEIAFAWYSSPFTIWIWNSFPVSRTKTRTIAPVSYTHLLHGGKAEVALLFHFDVVVAETDCAEHEGEDEGREHGDVPMHVISVAGDQKRRENAHAEQNPAHGDVYKRQEQDEPSPTPPPWWL